MDGRSRAAVVAVALLGSALLAACSRGAAPASPAAGGGTTTETTTVVSVPATPAEPAPLPSGDATRPAPAESGTVEPAPAAESGKQFGYVKGTRLRKSSRPLVYVVVDYAQFLTGDAAAKAADAAGEESPPPNDYFILNDSGKLRDLPFAADARVGYQSDAGSTKLRYVTPEQFATAVSKAAESDAVRQNPYWIWLSGGQVTRMEQQYLP